MIVAGLILIGIGLSIMLFFILKNQKQENSNFTKVNHKLKPNVNTKVVKDTNKNVTDSLEEKSNVDPGDIENEKVIKEEQSTFGYSSTQNKNDIETKRVIESIAFEFGVNIKEIDFSGIDKPDKVVKIIDIIKQKSNEGNVKNKDNSLLQLENTILEVAESSNTLNHFRVDMSNNGVTTLFEYNEVNLDFPINVRFIFNGQEYDLLSGVLNKQITVNWLLNKLNLVKPNELSENHNSEGYNNESNLEKTIENSTSLEELSEMAENYIQSELDFDNQDNDNNKENTDNDIENDNSLNKDDEGNVNVLDVF